MLDKNEKVKEFYTEYNSKTHSYSDRLWLAETKKSGELVLRYPDRNEMKFEKNPNASKYKSDVTVNYRYGVTWVKNRVEWHGINLEKVKKSPATRTT